MWGSKLLNFWDICQASFYVQQLVHCRAHICHGYHGLYLWRKNCHPDKFLISVKILNNLWSFIEIYAVFVLTSKIVRRKICAEKISVEKKWQIWGLQGWRASEQSSGVMLRAFGRPTKIIWKSESFQLCRLIKKSWFCRIKSCHQTVCLICHLSERCSKNNGICVSHVMLFV